MSELGRISRGTFNLRVRTIYPAVFRLERASLLASEWSRDGAGRRRVYRLTADGERVQGKLGLSTPPTACIGWPAARRTRCFAGGRRLAG